MRILLTGASSMTGMWFARHLAEAGHDVTATFSRASLGEYGDSLRSRRVALALERVTPLYRCRFGDDAFCRAVAQHRFDVVCHHGAEVTGYKAPDFDVCEAVRRNTWRIIDVLTALRKHGGGRLVLTDTFFQGGEGAGSEGLPHFSPYGLSKAISGDVFRYYCQSLGVTLGRFVIPNPFGPYEEPRFTAYLIRNWVAGDTPAVRTPAYVRDNIHVTLLAAAYVRFVERFVDGQGPAKTSPSGYIETQGAFAQRFAREMAPRLRVECPLQLAHQTEFTEPRVRINTDLLDPIELRWDERAAWDEIARYYQSDDAMRA